MYGIHAHHHDHSSSWKDTYDISSPPEEYDDTKPHTNKDSNPMKNMNKTPPIKNEHSSLSADMYGSNPPLPKDPSPPSKYMYDEPNFPWKDMYDISFPSDEHESTKPHKDMKDSMQDMKKTPPMKDEHSSLPADMYGIHAPLPKDPSTKYMYDEPNFPWKDMYDTYFPSDEHDSPKPHKGMKDSMHDMKKTPSMKDEDSSLPADMYGIHASPPKIPSSPTKYIYDEPNFPWKDMYDISSPSDEHESPKPHKDMEDSKQDMKKPPPMKDEHSSLPADMYGIHPPPPKEPSPPSKHEHNEPTIPWKDAYWMHPPHDEMVHHEMKDEKKEEKKPQKRPVAYYYIGRKLYLIPAYFTLFFMPWVLAVLLRHVWRHKIKTPYNYWQSQSRSQDKITNATEIVTRAIQTGNQKYR
ncbi:hypothetical protein L9F63_005002 [Diploptera punctata]|uniref:Uncharacterized protein n=1 Tax=Diploptera punctata TaxID=6984 RepID=A0AAD7ZDN9_DIPPU|nr:hypothetical protein L9F63_005002 [Diploptera punctata]